MKNVIIIGNGISGVSAARHIRKNSDYKITIISSETDHFFSRTALMYIYMGHMKYENTKPYEDWFWKKNKISLLNAHVNKIDFKSKTLFLDNNNSLPYDDLILALGSKPNKFGWPGQDLKGVQGLYSFQDLQAMEENSKDLKHAVIVGGGLIGIEMAEMFLSRNIKVTFLVREASFWSNVLPKGESNIINRHILEHHIDLKLGTELEEILSDEKGRVRGIKSKDGEEINCQFVGLTAGVSPNISFLKNSDLECDKGILIDRKFKTNLENVYAIGDCAQFKNPPPARRPIEQVWYTGRMHGEVAAMNICSKEMEYLPGPWFNSAKFLDIEYQTYGIVMPDYGTNENGLYWEHDDGKKCIHIVYEKDTWRVIGVNFFGIRHRHEVWEKWLKENKTLQYILENIQLGNFDPEFFDQYEAQLVKLYNSLFPENPVKMKRRKRFLELIGL